MRKSVVFLLVIVCFSLVSTVVALAEAPYIIAVDPRSADIVYRIYNEDDLKAPIVGVKIFRHHGDEGVWITPPEITPDW